MNLRLLFLSTIFFIFAGCTEGRVKKYRDLLDPLLGTAKKPDVAKVIGSPVSCKPTTGGVETCEYRTSKGRNYPVPDSARKQQAMGPDLSPYDYFDVLHLHYDGFGVLKDWTPVQVNP